uniref:Uncharacterized protein n=1 Tax=Anguilla anguilla TaxID=7936 RepID=A0A0E9UGS8_ANGAN
MSWCIPLINTHLLLFVYNTIPNVTANSQHKFSF